MSEESKLITFLSTILKESIFALGILAVAVIVMYRDRVELSAALVFILPYYLLWVTLVGISVWLHNKPFKAIWHGNIRKEGIYLYPNVVYALSFLFGCIVIFMVQSKYA